MDLGALGGAAQDHPQRVGARHVAHGQAGVVRPHRAGADHHGIALGPQSVGVGPGRAAGDPLAGAVGRRRAAVEGGGQLQHHVRPAGAPVLQVRGELGPDGVGPDADVDLDPGGAQPGDARPRDLGVGVLDADQDPGDPGRDHRVGARAGAALVAAGLEGGGQGGAPGVGTGGVEGDDLGVAAAGRLGGAHVVDPGGGPQHGADPGVGRGGRAHGGRGLDGAGHQRFVLRWPLLHRSVLHRDRAGRPHTAPRSHPDSHRRPRSSTGSAPAGAGVRGLSPPVGTFTQPREGVQNNRTTGWPPVNRPCRERPWWR